MRNCHLPLQKALCALAALTVTALADPAPPDSALPDFYAPKKTAAAYVPAKIATYHKSAIPGEALDEAMGGRTLRGSPVD